MQAKEINFKTGYTGNSEVRRAVVEDPNSDNATNRAFQTSIYKNITFTWKPAPTVTSRDIQGEYLTECKIKHLQM